MNKNFETHIDLLNNKSVEIDSVKIENEYFFKISNSDLMRPFFMSIVSDSNHWMFISSNGGLSAGRKDSEHSLFPYYTDDKITESSEITGSKSIFQIYSNNKNYFWEPFSIRQEGLYNITRNIYKNIYSNKVMFEEINHDFDLTFRYQWNSSNTYGFIKKSQLINNSDSNIKVSLLDGIQNILPYGVPSGLQNNASNLVDAYKRCELEKEFGLGIYSLSAIIVDKAEPSEALKANIVWSIGLENPKYLLSSLQLNNFRKGKGINNEIDIKAEKGAYFVSHDLNLDAKSNKEWMIVADVNKTHSDIVSIIEKIAHKKDLYQKVNYKIKLGTKRLTELISASDGLQLSNDKYRDSRHFSNVLFNIMRGGIFDNNYTIEKWDFDNYLSNANKIVYKSFKKDLDGLPEKFTVSKLKELIANSKDQSFNRLALEYMPLKFSRRHGDPSRPWNRFSINTRSEIDGSKILDYEGNWRDIFQNWEALAHSYPEFIESMIAKFLNASTFDGYNPYRVTKDGFDWETIEPDNPWSYIGYWGDHQIIYLLKFLEFIQNHKPGKLESYFENDIFVYANVPYKIKSYEEILKNPKNTIKFDSELDEKIRKDRLVLGADAALMTDESGNIYKVNFIEKILATVLAKISNFIPEAGIWMNTQRPEWNDANNALVGNGASMVTLSYLRRFLNFFNEILNNSNLERVKVSNELIVYYRRIAGTLDKYNYLLDDAISDKDRKCVLDELGRAASDYREHIYKRPFWGEKRTISLDGLKRFVKQSLNHLDHSIDFNKRKDDLYHAYNIISISENGVSISNLSEMLEGQVAALSSGYIPLRDCLNLLDALKKSNLFRDDQYSYILYPNKNLPRFLKKNIIPEKSIKNSGLLSELLKDGNNQIFNKDIKGEYHFNGSFNNAQSLDSALSNLENKYQDLLSTEKDYILNVFEEVFNHKAFTGRSGTFYGYEGLGSIYWHMVSKLQLAVQECCFRAVEQNESEEVIGKLLEHYYEINEGIGVHKPPKLYGAFSTDPYSHTPFGKGAQQPGMTGQVKEDILCRFGELGVFVKKGKLCFNPCLLRKDEMLIDSNEFNYFDVNLNNKKIKIDKGSLCFTYCQVPIIYKLSNKDCMKIEYSNDKISKIDNLELDFETSKKIFERTGEVSKIIVELNEMQLR